MRSITTITIIAIKIDSDGLGSDTITQCATFSWNVSKQASEAN